MRRIEIINRIKYNKCLFGLYNRFGSIIIDILKLFVRTDDRLIVFVSFGGRRFDDSPRCIYEKMIEEERFSDYRLVWAFIEPDSFIIPQGDKIRIDTPKYYLMLLKARCWVTNSGVERGLSFSGKKSFYLNTWHGTAVKKMGIDLTQSNASFKSKSAKIDIMLAQGQYDVDLFSRVFGIPVSSFRITGLPRNDELFINNNSEVKHYIKHNMGIPDGKKVILYAPTFREYTKDSGNNVIQSVPLSFERLKRELGDEYVFLLRAHYEVLKVLDIQEDSFLHNVSSYPNLNDLMIVSDLLISDYSSIFFDYSILEKPMLCYAYDYQEYQDKRGLYFDIREALQSYIVDEDSLIEEVKNASLKPEEYKRRAVLFRSGFVAEYGEASKKCVDIIYDAIH